MEVVVVLDVEVRSPVADLRCTLELGDFKDREVKRIVDNNLLLLLVDEVLSGRWRNVVVGTIGDGCTGLGHGGIRCELNVLRGRV